MLKIVLSISSHDATMQKRLHQGLDKGMPSNTKYPHLTHQQEFLHC